MPCSARRILILGLYGRNNVPSPLAGEGGAHRAPGEGDSNDFEDGAILEMRPGTMALLEAFAVRAALAPFAALIVDYGYSRPSSGDTVQAEVTVKELIHEKRRVVLSTVCTVNGKVVIDGDAVVMPTSSANRVAADADCAVSNV